ncbi:MAG: AAC(3) family N-acetyltransferase [Roseiflexaceae bacterium]|nr:AAC(3) family N-acetyltransferase [Roseiflexaceae bacterium]
MSYPNTVASLASDLAALGIQPGMTLLVHSSLSALGWVAGGPVAVVYALEQALGPQGTLVMPTHTTSLTEPSRWANPPVPEAWWETIRRETPAYDPALTPTRKMGAIVECFRGQPGTLRSQHPHVSFAARGPFAARIVAQHRLEAGLGEGSPLARVYELGGHVLLLGVGHGNNTSLHLAEYRANFAGKTFESQGAPIFVDGVRQWAIFDDLNWNDEDFDQIGADFAADTGLECTGRIGIGTGRLMPQPELVDYAVLWMERRRLAPGKDG